MDYDKDLINREVVAVCDHYLTGRQGEGKRKTYDCPACDDHNFEVDPQYGYAGCFDPGCEAPTTTDALGVISYFEGNPLSGEGFVMCLKKGYEILGLPDPEEEGNSPQPSSNGANRQKAMTPRRERKAGREKAMTPRTDRSNGQEGVSGNGEGSVHSSGPRWGAATSSPPDSSNSALMEQPIQAWQENEDGTRSPVAAVVIRDPEPETDTEDGEELEDAELAGDGVKQADRRTEPTDEKEQAHEVFEELLKLCKREERDESFLIGRGLDEQTVEEGRFGSISKSRCNYVVSKLRQKFSEEELVSVPGFRKAEGGQLRFSLYGDYALIPYFDNEGYIRTVEGRFTGEEMGSYDKKYKALLNSAVHLYVHPRYRPEEVVAICEGAIGAMVAARYGFAVASIKGYRNYRCRLDGDGKLYTILPELEGVDFAGKVVVYIPDVDVKPKSYESVMKTVPDACHWLIERQVGIPKVAMLPEGAKDLDAWILSLDEEQREQGIEALLAGAIPVEQFEAEYLSTEVNTEYGQDPTGLASVASGGVGDSEKHGKDEACQHEAEQAGEKDESNDPQKVGGSEEDSGSPEPELEEIGGWEDSGGSAAGRADSTTVEEDNTEVGLRGSQDNGSGGSNEGTDGFREPSQVDDTGGDTEDGNDSSPWEQLQLGVEATGSEDVDETAELKNTEVGTSELEVSESGHPSGEDQTQKLEPEPAPALEQDDYLDAPTYHVGVKGERYLYVVAYVVAAALLSIVAWLAVGGWLSWAGSVVLGAGLAIWTTVGFRKLYRWHEQHQLRRHIEGE